MTEAAANAIDAKAARVDVELKTHFDDKAISFHNDGPPMSEEQFSDYHVIARSSKSRGTGIGFAGIGAKVYLAAWDRTAMRTETSDGNAALGSEMYVKNGKLKATYTDSAMRKRGTLYRVSLKPDDYAYLEKNAHGLISDAFDPAISGKLAVTLNGRRIKPWNPRRGLKKSFTVTAQGEKFRVLLSVTEDDMEAKKLHVQYHVSGKVISTKRPDWIPEVKPEYARRIHAYVDAVANSQHLNLNKTGFKAGTSRAVGLMFKEVDRRVYDVLKNEGYVDGDPMRKFERTSLTRFFERLFKDPKYAFLNPNARGGRGPGSGPGAGGAGGGGPG